MYHIASSLNRVGRPLEAAMAHREGATKWQGDLEYDSKNAKGYFDPSSMIKQTHKTAAKLMFRLPGLDKKFSKFLEKHADPRHLRKA